MTAAGPLSFEKDGDVVALAGAFTEKADFDAVFDVVGDRAVLDLRAVEHINSTGVRAWIQFATRLRDAGKHVTLRGASVMFVSQINMIANFTVGFPLESFFVRFACAGCGAWSDVLVPVAPSSLALLQSSRPCACGDVLELDDLLDPYRSLLADAGSA
jgi:ABC-type transporter Mla MlaB component